MVKYLVDIHFADYVGVCLRFIDQVLVEDLIDYGKLKHMGL